MNVQPEQVKWVHGLINPPIPPMRLCNCYKILFYIEPKFTFPEITSIDPKSGLYEP